MNFTGWCDHRFVRIAGSFQALTFGALILVLALEGCAIHVPVEKVYGEYVASYPYGTETIKLNRDGTFLQTVEIAHHQPVATRGRWEFEDKNDSRVTLYGAMNVDNGFGSLRTDWQRPNTGLWSESVKMHWFRIVMGSGGEYPHFKQ